MPGNVTVAVAAAVLPAGTCAAFSRVREWACNTNQYTNGEIQVGKLVTNYRSRWALTRRLPATPMEALRLFYLARLGPHQAFYFYDPEEGPTDPTGVATTGRYIVRFAGAFTAAFGVGRHAVSLQLVEVV